MGRLDGIPSSMIGAGQARAILATYEPSFFSSNETETRFTDMEQRVQNVEDEVATVMDVRLRQSLAIKPGIANGDCSQWSHGTTITMGTLGTTSAAAPLTTYPSGVARMHQRAVPIMDRWYHVADLSGLQLGPFSGDTTQDFTVTAQRVPLDPLRSSGTQQPLVADYGLQLNYKGAWSDHLATDNFGMMAIYHRIPNVRLWHNTKVTLSFWLYLPELTNLYVQVARQYNRTKPDLEPLTTTTNPLGYSATEYTMRNSVAPGIEVLYRNEIHRPESAGWVFIERTVDLPALDSTRTIDDAFHNHGLVIMIGPMFHAPFMDLVGNLYRETWGDLDTSSDGAALMKVTGGNPNGLTFVLTEFQLVESGTAQSFIKQDESLNTQPYMCQIKPILPVAGNDQNVLAMGQAVRTQYLDYFNPANNTITTASYNALKQYSSTSSWATTTSSFNLTENMMEFKFPRLMVDFPDCLTLVDLVSSRVVAHMNNFNISNPNAIYSAESPVYQAPITRYYQPLDYSPIRVDQCTTYIGATGVDHLRNGYQFYQGSTNTGTAFAEGNKPQGIFALHYPVANASYHNAFLSIMTPPYTLSDASSTTTIVQRYTTSEPGLGTDNQVISTRCLLLNNADTMQLGLVFYHNECDPGTDLPNDYNMNKVTPPATGNDTSQSIWSIATPQVWAYTEPLLKHSLI